MSAGPRIVFTRFLTGDSPKLAPWIAHLGRVSSGTSAPPVAGGLTEGAIVWQLVSANNRELARGFAVHASFENASATASSVIALSSDLHIQLVSEPTRGAYGWFAALGDVPVVSCARWYDTERSRRVSVELALRSLALAELHPGTRLIDPALMERGPEPAFS